MRRIVPGLHSVREALKVRPKAVELLWLREGELNPDLEELFDLARRNRVQVKRLNPKSMEREASHHQGVVAFVTEAPQWPALKSLKLLEEGMILALDGLEDPQNVGSLMRSAWNFGAIGMIVTQDRSSGMTPASQKVAVGAFEHLPIQEVVNLHSELNTLKDAGFWVYGLSGENSESLHKIKFPRKVVLVIGSESSGLRKPVISACDALVGIPQSPTGQSFNAAVAGAIVGSEFMRQLALPK